MDHENKKARLALRGAEILDQMRHEEEEAIKNSRYDGLIYSK
jgi:hypothetical protein